MLRPLIIIAAVFIAIAGGAAVPPAWRSIAGVVSSPTDYGSSSSIYFAPATNLEDVDLRLIGSARASIDIAMYTFTDRRIAAALASASSRGVAIRIYRDGEQFARERERGSEALALLLNRRNIHIRVKAGTELMHEKAFLADGRMLRDGSGNWSVSAARYQDNEITLTANASEAAAFAANFAGMWNRADNEAIQ